VCALILHLAATDDMPRYGYDWAFLALLPGQKKGKMVAWPSGEGNSGWAGLCMIL